MYIYSLINLISIVPDSIKLELLKKELLKVYMEESQIKNFDDSCECYCLNFDTRNIIDLIEKANLTDDLLTELYRFAKNARKELNLKDTLFNVYDGVVSKAEEYEELNEKINSQKKI